MYWTRPRGTEERALAQIRTYWEALCEGGNLPLRSEVDPRGMEAALEYGFILERAAPGVARLRVAGMHLSDLMGMEVRGMPLGVFFEGAAWADLSAAIERAIAGAMPFELDLVSDGNALRPALRGRLLLLPLRT